MDKGTTSPVEGGPSSWHRECPAGMEDNSCGDVMNRAKRPEPPVLALIVRERKKIGYFNVYICI